MEGGITRGRNSHSQPVERENNMLTNSEEIQIIQQQAEPGYPAGSCLFFISSRVFSSGHGIEAPPKKPRQCNCRDTVSVAFNKWAGHGKGCPGGGSSGLSWRYLTDGQDYCNSYPKQQIFHPAVTKPEAQVEWPSWRCKWKEYYVNGREKSLRTAGLEVLHDRRGLFFYLLKTLNPLKFTGTATAGL